MAKVKLATDWLDICSGCHMAILDIDERIVELLNHVEITSSPVTDLKHPPKEGVDVGILSGAVSNDHQMEVAERMRRSPGATSVLLVRALMKLKEAFGETESLSLPKRSLEEEGLANGD